MVVVVLIDSVERLDEVVFASKTHVNKYPRKGSLVLRSKFGFAFFPFQICRIFYYCLEILAIQVLCACEVSTDR